MFKMKSFYLCALVFLFAGFASTNSYKIKLPSTLNKNDSDINLQIVNGINTTHNRFPYQVGILTLVNNNFGMLCGGFIISRRWIGTAAHCVMHNGQKALAKNVLLRTGLDKFFVKNRPLIPVESIHVNPNFTLTETGVQGDLALLHLAKDIEYKNGVSSACLDFRYKEHEFLYVSGYGAVEGEIHSSNSDQVFHPRVPGDQLKYTTVKEDKSLVFCTQPREHICVDPASYDKISGICQGDSGSPISSQQYDVLGVASTDHPIVLGKYIYDCVGFSTFTRLGAYANFIDRLIGKDNYCSKR